MTEESLCLYYQEGSSDKVYEAELTQHGAGWVVNFAYGRRGNALTTGTKTKNPVDYEVAKKTYDKLVGSKMAKGYKPAMGNVPASINVVEKEDTGVRPQLLNEIQEDDLLQYITDSLWCAQEKFDGRRRMIIKKGENITGANKKGLASPLPLEIASRCEKLTEDCILDGEDMGDHIMVFDDLTDPELAYVDRYALLKSRLDESRVTNPYDSLIPVKTAWTMTEKKELYEELVERDAEGIVFKKIYAAHTAGRPASKGDQVKFKFYDTASCIVTKVNGVKSSISVGVYDEDYNMISVGNVTVYPNQATPILGSIVEVKYLYYYPGGSLYQPILLEIRDDVDHKECVITQLKVKPELV